MDQDNHRDKLKPYARFIVLVLQAWLRRDEEPRKLK